MRVLNEKGQSTIEYILLIVVVVSVASALFNSAAFKRFVGEDSEFMQKAYKEMSYAYRHGRMGTTEEDVSNYTRDHETFFNKEEGRSRFFAPTSQYPE